MPTKPKTTKKAAKKKRPAKKRPSKKKAPAKAAKPSKPSKSVAQQLLGDLGKGLTAKQANFVRYYCQVGTKAFLNATEAAARAGYATTGRNTLHAIGFENLRKPNIAKAIQGVFRQQYSAADLTIERVLRDIEMTRQLALADGKYTAALRASDLHGRYLKMWVQKIEHLHTIEDATTEELLTVLSQVVGNIDGLNIAELFGGNGAAPGGHADTPGASKPH